MTIPKTKAVIISDIHFSPNNLELASTALRLALQLAEDLEVPLIISGDLTDTKAIIRGEVANRLIDLFLESRARAYIIPGNHDLLNEKSHEHSLNFLKPYAHVLDTPNAVSKYLDLNFIPYQADKNKFVELVNKTREGAIIVCHQGFKGANMGDYVQDKTSVDPALLGNRRIISGHYHRHQNVGPHITYVGNPYTMSFGEANDPQKGFCLLRDDGSLKPVPLNLRRHVIIDTSIDDLSGLIAEERSLRQGDLLWLKVRGPRSLLNALNKEFVGKALLGHTNFKLELIPETKKCAPKPKNVSHTQLFDAIIDQTQETQEQKTLLKELYRGIIGS